MRDLLLSYLNGGIAIAALAVGLVFLKFWRVSRDRFFIFFAAAFWAFALGATLRTIFATTGEHGHFVFLLPRLLGFVIIVVAILDKNRRGAD